MRRLRTFPPSPRDGDVRRVARRNFTSGRSHGRLLRWQFDTVTLAHRCRRGASTPSPYSADPDGYCERQVWGDTVEKVSFELSGRCRLGAASEGIAPQTGIGRAAGTSVASFRRFWAVAARWNSSRAPLGPR